MPAYELRKATLFFRMPIVKLRKVNSSCKMPGVGIQPYPIALDKRVFQDAGKEYYV